MEPTLIVAGIYGVFLSINFVCGTYRERRWLWAHLAVFATGLSTVYIVHILKS